MNRRMMRASAALHKFSGRVNLSGYIPHSLLRKPAECDDLYTSQLAAGLLFLNVMNYAASSEYRCKDRFASTSSF
jgi:hypothetical protein